MFPFCLPGLGSFFLFCSESVGADAPTVRLSYGTFRGFTAGNVTEYLGVPFASASRFETPKPPKELPGVQDATSFGPACPQQALSPLPGIPFARPVYPSISEECLTLDVFTPSKTHNLSKLPVFVWIHGGAYQYGNSRDKDVTAIVARSIETGEPIIAVALNYRVSAFGFLPGKEVGAAGVGNLGLRDQIFALEWVNKQIRAFGGDPKRVVIGGLSAGSVSATTLLLSNKQNSSALFRGAFLESGSQIPTPTLQDGQPVYDGLVAANNCSSASDTLDCLRRVPFDSFMATVNNTQNMFSYQSLSIIWRPYIDGDVVERALSASVSQGLYAKVPIMTGSCDDEGTLFSISTSNITTNAEFLDYVHSNYLPKSSQDEISSIGSLYPEDPAQGSPFDTGTANQLSPQYKRLAAFQGDFIFTAPRRFLLEHASPTQNTWGWCKLHGLISSGASSHYLIVSKLGKDASPLGTLHAGDVGVWRSVNFINTLNPNMPAEHATEDAKLSVLWPQWKTPSESGSSSLLTLTDNNGTIITADDFRLEPIRFLNNLLLEEADTQYFHPVLRRLLVRFKFWFNSVFMIFPL
ncbi:Alpha/Beta hydrolase protein [Mycena metata]|uniref:Carboxylic ester hydrolase n=1 Tax=Mycena metata TaxID=1033252 RepID=A0AAD7MLS7_9AGAR|nr:Alpha/Beta hydrolase protein [Mycena metata]